MAHLKAARDYVYDWSHERPGDWTSEAACIGHAHLFSVEDKSQEEGDGGAVPGRWASYDRSKFKKAMSICRNCPVQQQCGESATREDFNWTVRAGRMPAIFNVKPVDRPKTTVKFEESLSDVLCRRGHLGQWVIYAKGKQCRSCSIEDKINLRRRRGIKAVTLKTVCRNGHTGEYVEHNGRRQCQGCRRESSQRLRDKRKADKMEA